MSRRNNPYKTSITNVIKILEKQSYKCYYCNCKITSRNATCEHIKAYSKVWKEHKLDNIAIACKRCNKLKGDISEELFRAWYVAVNFKPWYDLQSYNKAIKVRNPIKWYNKMFPTILKRNKNNYNLVIKLY